MADNCNITAEELQKACKLLGDLKINFNNVTDLVNRLTEQIKNGEFDTKKGISLLDLKNNTFLSYISNLMYTTLLKLSGKSLIKHPVIDRLIEQRVVIERLSPYETKLKHQIGKYLKAEVEEKATVNDVAEASTSTGLSASDFAVGDDNDKEQQEEEDGEGSDPNNDDDDTTKKDVKYRLPKISQNKFEDNYHTTRETKAAGARRRFLNSAMMQDALYEHNTEPDVIHNSTTLQKRAQKMRDEIQKFEEDRLTRIQVSKRDRQIMKPSNTAGQMHGELLGFCDVGMLNGEDGAKSSKKRKRSMGGKKSKGKKGGKKRRT